MANIMGAKLWCRKLTCWFTTNTWQTSLIILRQQLFSCFNYLDSYTNHAHFSFEEAALVIQLHPIIIWHYIHYVRLPRYFNQCLSAVPHLDSIISTSLFNFSTPLSQCIRKSSTTIIRDTNKLWRRTQNTLPLPNGTRSMIPYIIRKPLHLMPNLLHLRTMMLS